MLELYFFNVGHGDSIAIKFPNDEWAIIDCNRAYEKKIPNVLNFLKEKGVEKLNFICISHPHTDHVAGIDVLEKSFLDSVKTFYVYGINTNSPCERNKESIIIRTLMSFTNNAKKNTDKIVELNRNDVFSYGNVIIKILNPTNQIKNQLRLKQYSIEHPDFNSESVVMLIEYANKKVLLTGDSTINNWLEILEKYSDIKSDIVKISHHGSKNNNDYETLANIIKPGGIAIISTDGGVKYPSIPDENVIHMLKTELNCNVYLTSELGYSTIPADIDGDLESDDIIDLYSEIISEPSPIGYYKILISDSGDIQIEQG